MYKQVIRGHSSKVEAYVTIAEFCGSNCRIILLVKLQLNCTYNMEEKCNKKQINKIIGYYIFANIAHFSCQYQN